MTTLIINSGYAALSKSTFDGTTPITGYDTDLFKLNGVQFSSSVPITDGVTGTLELYAVTWEDDQLKQIKLPCVYYDAVSQDDNSLTLKECDCELGGFTLPTANTPQSINLPDNGYATGTEPQAGQKGFYVGDAAIEGYSVLEPGTYFIAWKFNGIECADDIEILGSRITKYDSKGTAYPSAEDLEDDPKGWVTITKTGRISGITLIGDKVEYDGSFHTITVAGVKSNDTVWYKEGDGDYGTTYPYHKDAGVYNIGVKITRDGCRDYIGSTSLVIYPKYLNFISNNPLHKLYDKTEKVVCTVGKNAFTSTCTFLQDTDQKLAELSGVVGDDDVQVGLVGSLLTATATNVESAVDYVLSLEGVQRANYVIKQIGDGVLDTEQNIGLFFADLGEQYRTTTKTIMSKIVPKPIKINKVTVKQEQTGIHPIYSVQVKHDSFVSSEDCDDNEYLIVKGTVVEVPNEEWFASHPNAAKWGNDKAIEFTIENKEQ